jgi:hypothetical protein
VFPAVYFIFNFELNGRIANNYVRIIRKLDEQPGLSGLWYGLAVHNFFVDVMMICLPHGK